MRTILGLTLIVLLGASIGAMATEGPWGAEDPNQWCLDHGDYSNPDAPTFPAECTAFWHPEQHPEQHPQQATEVLSRPPQHRPAAQAAPLAATGASLGWMAAVGLVVASCGALLLGASKAR